MIIHPLPSEASYVEWTPLGEELRSGLVTIGQNILALGNRPDDYIGLHDSPVWPDLDEFSDVLMSDFWNTRISADHLDFEREASDYVQELGIVTGLAVTIDKRAIGESAL